MVGIGAAQEQVAFAGLDDVTAERAAQAADEAENLAAAVAVITVDEDRVRGRNAARREVDVPEEDQRTLVGVTAHLQVGDEVDLILQGDLRGGAVEAEGADSGDLVDGELARAEGEIAEETDVDARVEEGAAAVVIAVGQRQTVGPVADGHVAVDHGLGGHAVFGHVGADLEAIGAGQDVLVGEVAEEEVALVAAEADAVDPVGARAQGGSVIDLRPRLGRLDLAVARRAAADPEPELAAARRGLESAHVQRRVLPARAETDAAEVAAGRLEADLAGGRNRRDEVGQLGLRGVETDHEAREAVTVGLRADFLRGDVTRGEQVDDRTGVEDDVAGAERRAGADQALDRAGRVITAGGVDVESERAIGSEGVGDAAEFQGPVTELGEAASGDRALQDGASVVIETGADDVVVGAERGRPREREVTAGGEGDRGRGAQVREHEVAQALLGVITAVVEEITDETVRVDADGAGQLAAELLTDGEQRVHPGGMGQEGKDMQVAAVEDDVAPVGDGIDGGTRRRDGVFETERAGVDDDVAGDGVAAPQEGVTRAELDEAAGEDARVDRRGLATLLEDVRGARARGAEVEIHGIGEAGPGRRQDGVDGRATGDDEAAGSDREAIARGVRRDVLIRTQGVDRRIITDAEDLRRGEDIDGLESVRERGGRELAGRVVATRVLDLADARRAGARQGLETAADAHGVVTDERVRGGVDDPHRGEAAVDDPQAVGGRTGQRDGAGGDQALELRRITDRDAERVTADGIQLQGAVGGVRQGADAQGDAAGIGTGQGDLAALGDREVADGLDGLRRGGAAEAERAAVQVDAGGIVPAPFPADDGTDLVVDDDLTARTQDEAVRVGAGGGVEEGGRAVVGERVGGKLEVAEDFDDTGAERRGAGRSRARLKRHPRALEDRGAAAEVVRVADDDIAGGARLRAAEPVVTFQTDLETRVAGEHVVRAAEDEAGIRSARDAVDIARADAERRGEVVDFRIEEALQDRAAVADGGEVERRIPHRTGERQGHAVSAAEVGRGEDGRGEIAVEDDGAEGVELAEGAERGRGVQAAVAGETQRGAGVDADVGRA